MKDFAPTVKAAGGKGPRSKKARKRKRALAERQAWQERPVRHVYRQWAVTRDGDQGWTGVHRD